MKSLLIEERLSPVSGLIDRQIESVGVRAIVRLPIA